MVSSTRGNGVCVGAGFDDGAIGTAFKREGYAEIVPVVGAPRWMRRMGWC
jgi:hypothetical protein